MNIITVTNHSFCFCISDLRIMECRIARIATLLYIGTCCMCLNVDSQKPGGGLNHYVDKLKYDDYESLVEKFGQKTMDDRDGSEGKSATPIPIHTKLSERSILQNTFFLSTLCAQWTGPHTHRRVTGVLMCLYRNSTTRIRNCFRPFKIWCPIHVCRQSYSNAAIKMMSNNSVGYKDQFVRTSTQMCNIMCRLISNITSDFPETFRPRPCSQPLFHEARRFRCPCGQLWPRCGWDVCPDCLYGHFRKRRAHNAVCDTGNRQRRTLNATRFKCYRAVLKVFNFSKHMCAVFDWQNKHANSYLRHRKQRAKEYMKNMCLFLKCLPYQCRTHPSRWIVSTELYCELCVSCVFIVHSNHTISWRHRCLEETKHINLDWKIHYNNSMVLTVIAEGTVFHKKLDPPSKLHSQIARNAGSSVFKFLHGLDNSTTNQYRTEINKNDVLKNQQVKSHARNVKEEIARGYVSENQSKVLSFPVKSTTTSTTSPVKYLESDGHAVDDLAGLSHSGQHDFSASILVQSTDPDYKPISLDNYPRSSSTHIFGNPPTIQEMQIGHGEAVFQSFLLYFQRTNSSPNSTQEPVIRDTHTIETNRVSLTAQLHMQVNGNTNMAAQFRKRRELGVVEPDVTPVNMAILLPMSQNRLFCMERVSPAIEIAMERVNKATCVQWRAETCVCSGPTPTKLLVWIP